MTRPLVEVIPLVEVTPLGEVIPLGEVTSVVEVSPLGEVTSVVEVRARWGEPRDLAEGTDTDTLKEHKAAWPRRTPSVVRAVDAVRTTRRRSDGGCWGRGPRRGRAASREAV